MQKFVKIPVVIIVLTLWGVIGLIVALANDYGVINKGSDYWSLALAIVLWPIVLLGGDVSIKW